MRGEKYLLLAEDDLHLAQLMLKVLGNFQPGTHVILVQDGAEALDYLYGRGKFKGRPGGDPVLLLLDLKMPKVDGLEVLQQVKTDERLKVIPTVMLTSSQDEKDIFRSYQLGANAYIVKPAAFQEFTSVIKQIALFWTNINEPPPSLEQTTSASALDAMRR